MSPTPLLPVWSISEGRTEGWPCCVRELTGESPAKAVTTISVTSLLRGLSGRLASSLTELLAMTELLGGVPKFNVASVETPLLVAGVPTPLARLLSSGVRVVGRDLWRSGETMVASEVGPSSGLDEELPISYRQDARDLKVSAQLACHSRCSLHTFANLNKVGRGRVIRNVYVVMLVLWSMMVLCKNSEAGGGGWGR